MIKVTKISVGKSRKVSLGNYNMVELVAGAEATLDGEKDEPKEGYKMLRALVDEELKEQWKPYKQKLEPGWEE